MVILACTYQGAKLQGDALESAYQVAAAALVAIGGGSGALGLTPDAVRARPDYRATRAASEAAWQRLRAHNGAMVKTYGAEMKAERAERRARGVL